MDDEYFRFMLVSGATTSEHPQTQRANDALRRSLRKPGKLGFARLVNQSLIRTDAITPAGIYLGKVHGIKLEKQRIKRVSQRIIRGLFYHEFGYPVPEGYEVDNTFRQGSFADVVQAFQGVRFPPWKRFGNGVFAYTFLPTQEDPHSIAWLQIYYEGLPFMGFTNRPELGRNAA